MNRIKCSGCNLVNAVEEITCRRCGRLISQTTTRSNSPRGPREAAKRSSWFYTIIILLLIGWAAAYLYTGIEKSYNDVNVNDSYRIAAQPKQQPAELTNRSEADQKRAGSYKAAIQTNSGLSESQKHNEEIKKLMPPEPEKTPK